MTAAFGEITYDQAATDDPVTQGEAEPQEEIALDDPRLLSSENVETNEAGDAYAVAPPVPDGKWLVRLKLADQKNAKGETVTISTRIAKWKTPPTPYYFANVEATILDNTGKFDGTKLTDYHVKSLLGDRGPGAGTSQMATIVRHTGGKVPVGSTQIQTKDAFVRHLAGEPSAVIEVKWDASCQSCQEKAKKAGEKAPKPFKQGMHSFPQVKAGVYEPQVSCPVCKSPVRAQARIVGYYPAVTPHQG